MRTFKIDNLITFFYSIMGQVMPGDYIKHKVVSRRNNEKIYEKSITLSNDEFEANVDVMDIMLMDAKRAIMRGDKVIFDYVKDVTITVYKENEYYVIDNFDEVLKYIMFEVVRYGNDIAIKISSKNGDYYTYDKHISKDIYSGSTFLKYDSMYEVLGKYVDDLVKNIKDHITFDSEYTISIIYVELSIVLNL